MAGFTDATRSSRCEQNENNPHRLTDSPEYDTHASVRRLSGTPAQLLGSAVMYNICTALSIPWFVESHTQVQSYGIPRTVEMTLIAAERWEAKDTHVLVSSMFLQVHKDAKIFGMRYALLSLTACVCEGEVFPIGSPYES